MKKYKVLVWRKVLEHIEVEVEVKHIGNSIPWP